MKFMNLPEEYSKPESYFQILQIPHESGKSFRKGTAKGPEEIIKASNDLEYYDEQFGLEPYEKGIHVHGPIRKEEVEEKIKSLEGKFIISLGGDHSITPEITKCLEGISVIVLDAHSDFRDEWNESKNDRACASKRVSEKHKTLVIGVRSQDKEESQEISQNPRIQVIKSYEYSPENLKQCLENLSEKIYLSIDTDFFDPSFIRNTTAPEPGGFLWNQTIQILETIFKSKNVIAADIAEFSPTENFYAEAFSLAKLCYKLMALKLID